MHCHPDAERKDLACFEILRFAQNDREGAWEDEKGGAVVTGGDYGSSSRDLSV